MKPLIMFLMYTYIFVSSWTHAYKITGWLTIPNTVLLVSFFMYTIDNIYNKKITLRSLQSFDLFLIISLFFSMISYLINGGNYVYILAYSFVYFLGYIFLKEIFIGFCSLEKMMKINCITVLFVASFSIIEFFSNKYLNVNIREVLHFGKINTATFNVTMSRSYAFSTEPTNLGLYFNSMSPLAVLFIGKSKRSFMIKMLYIITIAMGWIFAFSTAALVTMTISLILVLFLQSPKLLRNRKVNIKIISLIIALAILLLLILYFKNNEASSIIKAYLEPMRNKLFGTQNSLSGRGTRWKRDIIRFLDRPLFGYGPGSTTLTFGGSSVNWYINSLVENGFISTLFIIMFMLCTTLKICCSNVKYKVAFLLGSTSAIIYFSTLSTFYDPSFWLLLAFFYKSYYCKEND